MALPVPTLDHVVINARDDLDTAAETYRRLGFSLTERGYHSLGSMNHLAMFGTDYLELIAVPKDAPAEVRPDVMAAPFGLSGLVFGSEDSAATYASLAAAGVDIKPPREFTRPVNIGGIARDARFRTATLDQSVTPYGRVYFCHHFTRDLVWRDEWRHHPNGVVAVQRVVIVHPDPAGAAQLYAGMFGESAVRPSVGGMALIVAGTNVDIITEEALRRELGDAAPDPVGRSTYMAGLTFRTVSITQAARVLSENGVAGVSKAASGLLVPASSALNATLAFFE
jgi:hypothetical protein